jgi:MoxR-like ATPase
MSETKYTERSKARKQKTTQQAKEFEEVKSGVSELKEGIKSLQDELSKVRKTVISKSEVEEVSKRVAQSDLIDNLDKFIPKHVDPSVASKEEGKIELPKPRKISPTYRANRVGEIVRRAEKSKRPLMLSGPSGSGKSFVVEQELNKLGKGYYVLSCAEGLRLSDFTSRQELGKGETRWVLGTLPLSMKYGIPIILDEIDAIQQELAQILLRALEYRDLLIPQTGQTITAHEDWVCFATCNTLRDETGGYAGTRPSTALLNRFEFVACDYMTIQEEIEIFKQLGATQNLAERVAHWLKSVRPLHIKRQVSMAPSTRVGINIVRECLGLDEKGNKVNSKMTYEDALMLCFIGSLPEREIQNLKKNSLW